MRSPLHKIGWHPVYPVLILCAVFLSACEPPNNSPVISSLETEAGLVMPSGSAEVKCVASDADGDTLTYTWSATGGTFFGAGPDTIWVAPGALGTYVVTVAVTDGKGGEVKNQLTLGVRAQHRPVIESLTAAPRRVKKASTAAIKCLASDADGDELTYLWEATGGSISGEGATITWAAPTTEGSYIIRVIVTDSMGGGASKELEVTVTCGCGEG